MHTQEMLICKATLIRFDIKIESYNEIQKKNIDKRDSMKPHAWYDLV